MQACLWSYLLATVSSAAIDTVVVCPQPLQAALRPWVDYRQAQGHQVRVVPAGGNAEQIRERVCQAAKNEPVRFLLLVGDADLRRMADEEVRERSLPTFYEKSQVVVEYGSESTIASDHRYGDLDDDGLPDIAVGRLPVDSADELSRLVRRIIAYESSSALVEGVNDWQRRLHFVAGTSGFGPIADSVIESTTKNLLRDHIPPAYATTMTYASWQSPYCPDPAQFRTTAIHRFNEGGLFWVYMGHGHVRQVEFCHVPGERHPVFDAYAMPRLERRTVSPIAVFLACYTGAFDAREDCLAEEMLKADGGSVAVVAATRVTMPYAMSVLGLEMLDEYFSQRRATIGELICHAKRDSVLSPRDGANNQMLDAMARVLNPLGPDLAEERREHLKLFHLLGDPLLRIPHARQATITAVEHCEAGEWIDVNGTAPVDGTAEIELTVRRDRLLHEPPKRPSYDPDGFQEVYERSNEFRLTQVSVSVSQGRFQTRLKVPNHATGACHLRAYIGHGGNCALGSHDIEIMPAPNVARAKPAEAGDAR